MNVRRGALRLTSHSLALFTFFSFISWHFSGVYSHSFVKHWVNLFLKKKKKRTRRRNKFLDRLFARKDWKIAIYHFWSNKFVVFKLIFCFLFKIVCSCDDSSNEIELANENVNKWITLQMILPRTKYSKLCVMWSWSNETRASEQQEKPEPKQIGI